jgi:hypothetical protein
MKVKFLPSLLVLSLLALVLYAIWSYLTSKPVYNLPKVIWQFWDKEELPPMIQMIKENNTKKLQGWTIRLLNENTMSTYVSPFDIPPGYDSLEAAHKADWAPIRVGNTLHDRASFRFYWNILKRAKLAGVELPEEVAWLE